MLSYDALELDVQSLADTALAVPFLHPLSALTRVKHGKNLMPGLRRFLLTEFTQLIVRTCPTIYQWT